VFETVSTIISRVNVLIDGENISDLFK
jgi:hypothetical protein